MSSARLVLALAGLAVALLAVWSGARRLGWAAIALLVLYVGVRLTQRKRERAHREDDPE